jgi:hypothetical protein
MDARRARRLARLLRELERWLPAEEARLSAGRLDPRVRVDREARWQELLHLYERLCLEQARRRASTR